MTFEATLSWNGIFIIVACGIFFLVMHLEGRARDAVNDLRREHREKIAELSAENRKLNYEVSRLSNALASLERRAKY